MAECERKGRGRLRSEEVLAEEEAVHCRGQCATVGPMKIRVVFVVSQGTTTCVSVSVFVLKNSTNCPSAIASRSDSYGLE